MRILFAALHFGYFRNYESVIVALAARGHEICLLADLEESTGARKLVERLAAADARITFSMAPQIEGVWPWARLGRQVRHGLEFIRFADPRYDRVSKYRRRAQHRAPRLIRWMVGRAPEPDGAGGLARRLIALEHAIPAPPPLVDYFAAHRPDVVLLASVTNDGAPQMDHLKAALSLGVRTALPIYSWDHLSGKAVLHLVPDRLLVWNEAQRREAVTLHGLPEERVVVTGAQAYDQWFARAPQRAREAFCGELGLDATRPIVTYVCSVLSRPAPSEAPFVLEWIRRLRASSDARLREAGIIVRPHPERMREWDGVALSGLGPVVLRGRNPIDAESKADYYDSLYHSVAAVGIITSAFIEAAVIGRPSLTIEDPRFVEHQDGAPHYHYLRDPASGLLVVASDFDEHERQLAAVISGDPVAIDRARRFVAAFVRPFGPGVVATDRFVEAVEDLGRAPASRRVRFGRYPAQILAHVFRLLSALPVARRLFWSDLEAAIAGNQRARNIEEREIKGTLQEERRLKHAVQRRHQEAKLLKNQGERRVKAERVALRQRERERQRRASEAAKRRARLKAHARKLMDRSWRQTERAIGRSRRSARLSWARFKGGVKHVFGLG